MDTGVPAPLESRRQKEIPTVPPLHLHVNMTVKNLRWLEKECTQQHCTNRMCMCLILRFAPCVVATARLLLRVSRMIVQSSSWWLVWRSIQLTVDPERTVLIHRWIRQQFLAPYIRLSWEIGQRNTEYKKCSFSSWSLQPSQRQSIPWCFSTSYPHRLVWLQDLSSRDSSIVFLSNISAPSWRVSNLQVLVTRVLYDHEQKIRSHSSDVLQLANHSSEQCVSSCKFALFGSVNGVTTGFRILQWNKVQAFVHVLGNRFHSNYSVQIPSTPQVCEDWVPPLLVTTNFAMCFQNMSKVAGFAQVRGSSTWDATRDSFDSCTKRHRSKFS